MLTGWFPPLCPECRDGKCWNCTGTLMSFNVGDVVYVIKGGTIMSKNTARVTPTMVILDDGQRFNRTTGRMVGPGDAWDSWRIVHPTPELDARWRTQRIRDAATLLSTAVRVNKPSAIRKAYEKWDRLVTEETRRGALEQTPEPLPLDPEPWLCTWRYCPSGGPHRDAFHSLSSHRNARAFRPREGFEQDRAAYDREIDCACPKHRKEL